MIVDLTDGPFYPDEAVCECGELFIVEETIDGADAGRPPHGGVD